MVSHPERRLYGPWAEARGGTSTPRPSKAPSQAEPRDQAKRVPRQPAWTCRERAFLLTPDPAPLPIPGLEPCPWAWGRGPGPAPSWPGQVQPDLRAGLRLHCASAAGPHWVFSVETTYLKSYFLIPNSRARHLLHMLLSRSVASDCDPVGRSPPGLPVHHQLLQPAQTHVRRVGDAFQPSHPLSSPSPPAFTLSQHQGLFQ